MDGHGAGRPLHLSALSGQIVQLLPVDFDGGIHGRDLLDVSGKPGQHRRQLFRRDGGMPLLQHPAGDILRIGDKTQTQHGDIFLLTAFGKGDAAGGLSHKHRQHAGGHGVQRPGVAHLSGFQNSPQLGAHVHTCPVRGFVNDDDSVGHKISCCS